MANVTAFVGEWLSYNTPAELDQMALDGAHLVQLLRPHEYKVRLAKKFGARIHLSEQDLIAFIEEKYPAHAMVVTSYPHWFKTNVNELQEYIDSL